MPLPAPLVDALTDHGLSPQAHAPLQRRTWWQVGGPAECFLRVGNLEDLRAVARLCSTHKAPVFVLGNGTNLLISDRGIQGVVIQLTRDLAKADPLPADPTVIQAGAGTKLAVLLKKALRHGWTGLEVFAGIPGSVGGAVRMNAGARLGETREVLHEVDVVLPDGSLRTLPAKDLNMAYRHSDLPRGAIVATARFALRPGDPQTMRDQVQAHLDHRARTQPLDQPSCGSTFRNPPGDYAGRLIEASGLKGYRVGDAQVSEKHANFIVNLGGATADEVRAVIEHVQHTVKAQHGVHLEREVHFAGDWSHWPLAGA
ncbi:MAG: UDP-N-acetylmuramate dehydrogenase [Deltaproteobacteria bacterium]|nr:MAG: UDP-N-acetylmuramate dehydrogenase [Deltaproteobacteria bacterium]